MTTPRGSRSDPPRAIENWETVTRREELLRAPGSGSGWERLWTALGGDTADRWSTAGNETAVLQLARALGKLSIQEASVLILRYGLAPADQDIAPRTRREVSLVLERSYSYIAQLETRALATLRQALTAMAPGSRDRVQNGTEPTHTPPANAVVDGCGLEAG
jgi:DNA-directed RNA polymerase sigma subunit (sigma70/sigma32)